MNFQEYIRSRENDGLYTYNLLDFIKYLLNLYYANDNNTRMAQVIIAFVFGTLLSPWSGGIFFLFAFIIVNEIFFYLFSHSKIEEYDVFGRTGAIMASILGYIVGRTFTREDPLPNDNIPL